MKNLLITVKNSDGKMKSWRLSKQPRPWVLGSSLRVDLHVPSKDLYGVHGIFENVNNVWVYSALNEMNDKKVCTEIKDAIYSEKIGRLELVVQPYESHKTLFTNINNQYFVENTAKRAFQLFTVHKDGRLLETEIVEPSQKFISQFDTERKSITPEKCLDWKTQEVDGLTIAQRTIFLSEKELSEFFDLKKDKDARNMIYGAALTACFMIALSIFSYVQSSRQTPVVDNKNLQYYEVKMEKVAKKEKPPTNEPKTKAAGTPQPQNQPAAAQSIARSVKNSVTLSQISNLLGKITNRVQSKHLMVVTGVKSKNANVTDALVKESGRDWGRESSGIASASTQGVAGGRNVAGLGKLDNGTAGKAGLSLIEDEEEVSGGLDKEVIAQYIKTQLGQILYCYERQLSAQPNLFGKVAIKFTIAPQGTIETQAIAQTTLNSQLVEGCILQKVSKWKFPEPKNGVKVVVTYPFLFKSTN